MSLKRLLAAGLIAGVGSFAAPGIASAQSFGFSVSSGYPPPTYYDPGYAPGYYRPAYPAYRPDWRDHERWEREEARRRYWQRERWENGRWEHEQEARRHYWDERREHRWHGDDDDDDD